MNLFDDLINKFAACFPKNMDVKKFAKEDIDIFNFSKYRRRCVQHLVRLNIYTYTE